MDIWFLRHGENEWQVKDGQFLDLGLSKKGKRQIKNVIPKIKREGIAIIKTSPTKRTIQTARLLVENGVKAEIETFPIFESVGLPERKNLEDLIDVVNEERKWQEFWMQGFPGFESPKKFLSRIREGIVFLREKFIGEDTERNIETLILAHEEIMWAIAALKTGLPLKETIKLNIPHCQLLKLEFF